MAFCFRLTTCICLGLALLLPAGTALAGAVGYYPNGQVQWEYLFQNGQVCEAKWYDELGRLSARTVFRDGHPATNEGYRSDGSLEWQTRDLPAGRQEITRFNSKRWIEMRYETIAGQPDGASTHFYPGGQPRQLVTFRGGVPHGPARTYFESGQLESEYAYRDGQLAGSFRLYSPEGKLTAEYLYENGELR